MNKYPSASLHVGTVCPNPLQHLSITEKKERKNNQNVNSPLFPLQKSIRTSYPPPVYFFLSWQQLLIFLRRVGGLEAARTDPFCPQTAMQKRPRRGRYSPLFFGTEPQKHDWPPRQVFFRQIPPFPSPPHSCMPPLFHTLASPPQQLGAGFGFPNNAKTSDFEYLIRSFMHQEKATKGGIFAKKIVHGQMIFL